MLPIWEHRSIISANLLNPAFCGEVIRIVGESYQKNGNKNMSFSLVFIILPVLLHMDTRESLPRSTRKKLHDWLGEHDKLKIGLAERVKHLVPYTRESVLFLYRYNKLHFDSEGNLKIEATKSRKNPIPTTDEIQDIFERATFLGRWMSTFPKDSMIYTMFGIQP